MKSVLVVGGGSYQVPLIKRLVNIGYRTLCIDKNPASYGFGFASESAVIDIIDKEACLKYALDNKVDAVMTYGATITLPTVSYIAEKMQLPALPMETAELSKNKFAIKLRLKEAGCNILGTCFNMNSIEEAFLHSFDFPCVIKPSDGSGSKGVSIVYDKTELEAAIKYASDAARYGEFYCESYIDGDEYSVEAFVSEKKVFIYGIIKTTFEKTGFDNESIEYGHRTPSGLDVYTEDLIAQEVEKAIKCLGITMGSVNFDVIVSNVDSKPYIIDCGIRIGQNLIASHIIPFSRGVSILDNTIKQALGIQVDATPTKRICVATRLLIFNPGIITKVLPMNGEIGKDGIIDIVLRKNVGEEQRIYKEKSDTCGWVLCTGATPDEAEKFAIKARHKLKSYFVIE